MEYPFLHKIDGRSLPGLTRAIQRDLLKVSKVVRRRTGCVAWFDARRQMVFYTLGEVPGGGPYEERLFYNGRYIPISADQTVERIQITIGRSMSQKMAIVDKRNAENKENRDAKMGAMSDDVSSEARSRYAFELRKLIDPRSQRVFTMS